MKTYIVQLETHDDIISTQDKISWSKASRVLLIWPRRGRILERRVDLLLLLRHSQKIGAQLALVTRSGEVKKLAGEIGIPVFRNAEQAQRTAWRRPHTQRRVLILDDRARENAHALRAQSSRQRDVLEVKSPWIRSGIFILGVAAFLALVLFFAPGAEIRLQPVQKSQQMDINVWANPGIPAPNPSGGLPAQVVNVVVEGRDQVPSSSYMLIPDGFATGAVTLKNLTDQMVDVPQGSVMLSMDQPPKRFLVSQAVQVPAGPGKTGQANIRAETPGSASNLFPGQIQSMEGPLGLRLAVKNADATRGGTDQSSPAPAERDYQALRDQLLMKLQGNALAEIKNKVTSGQRLLVGTLRRGAVVEELREPARGQPGDHLQLTLRVEFEAWAVAETDLQAVAQAALDANRAPGFMPVKGSMQISFDTEPQLDTAQGAGQTPGLDGVTARWKIKTRQTLEASWANTDLVNALRGRSLAEAQQIVASRLALQKPPDIAMYPPFWARMPYLPARIIVVKQ